MESDMLEQLYCKYYADAVLYCTALTGDMHLAQDIASDAFVRAYLSLPKQVPSFRYWLLRVCKNLWRDHLRKHKREVVGTIPEDVSDGKTPELTYLQNERNQALWQEISRLSQPDRELVTLHYFSGVSLQEAASLLGKPYNAVRQRMVRLRRTLKQRLEEQGYGAEL